ncbi:peroxide stress protein YaaA [Gammaproteobacteria bacterium]|nr:peroxide stress protein YaaA [Gammaproteobacteria bacterium]
MIIVLSPAKTLDYSFSEKGLDFSVPPFLPKSKNLVSTMKKFNKSELSSLMGVSEKISALNHDRFQNWSQATKPSVHAKQAGFVFKGDVYQGLEFEKLSKQDINFAQKHLRILSGLYGVLKPLDIILPYRLEMGTKISVAKNKDLYEFWKEEITNHLNKDLKATSILVNLASIEYFSSVDTEKLKSRVISPVFKDFKNGQFKIISFYAKKARGLMAKYLIENRAKTSEDLQKFNLDGYKFSKKDSTEDSPVFLRK